jgi:hypothetical protein
VQKRKTSSISWKIKTNTLPTRRNRSFELPDLLNRGPAVKSTGRIFKFKDCHKMDKGWNESKFKNVCRYVPTNSLENKNHDFARLSIEKYF